VCMDLQEFFVYFKGKYEQCNRDQEYII